MGLPVSKEDFPDIGDGVESPAEGGESVFGDPDLGKADTLRYNVSSYVVAEKYDKAIRELEAFLARETDYPNFHERVERYVGHGIDLIHAMRAKRNFPGMASLTKSKQQELQEKVKDHFHELTETIKKIESVQRDLRIQDVRSTIWIMRALSLSVGAIIFTAFMVDFIYGGIGRNALVVFDDAYTKLFDWLSFLI